MNSKNVFLAFLIFLVSACNLPGNITPTPGAVSIPVTPTVASTVVSSSTETKPTKAITHTPTPESADEFSTDDLNEVPPDGILEEISKIGLGGVDRSCDGPYRSPTLATDPDDTELMLQADFVTCGWKAGEQLTFRITDPAGKVSSGSVYASDDGKGMVAYRPLLTDPQGIYRFEISGRGLTFESNAYFRAPVVPRFYILNARQLLFNNFTPNEKIRFFMYFCSDADCESYDFQGWQEYQVDARGQLLLNAPVRDGFFFVKTKSGLEVPLSTSDPAKISFEYSQMLTSKESENKHLDLAKKSGEYLDCRTEFVSRITFGNLRVAKVRVVAPKDSGIALFANPRTTARKIFTLPQGELLDVYYLNSMICNEGKAWRKIQISRNVDDWTYSYTGYVIEIDENHNYYLEQFVSGPITPTPAPMACPGALASRLSVSARVRVAYTDGTNMRIRDRAGFSQTTLYSVPEGTLLTILSGPKCADNSTWWQIRTDGGLEGWMAEYQGSVYLLEPY